MDEIFELIKAFNRLKERIVELIAKIDLLLKSPAAVQPDKDAMNRVSTDGYVEEEGACRILHICPRTLAKLRVEGTIPYIKSRKKILYQVSDLHKFMEKNMKGI
jgi:hypothetical protein